MKERGEVGHFRADYVTSELQEKVASGKAKVSDLPIGRPTNVSHDYHWGFDGKKWGGNPVVEEPAK